MLFSDVYRPDRVCLLRLTDLTALRRASLLSRLAVYCDTAGKQVEISLGRSDPCLGTSSSHSRSTCNSTSSLLACPRGQRLSYFTRPVAESTISPHALDSSRCMYVHSVTTDLAMMGQCRDNIVTWCKEHDSERITNISELYYHISPSHECTLLRPEFVARTEFSVYRATRDRPNMKATIRQPPLPRSIHAQSPRSSLHALQVKRLPCHGISDKSGLVSRHHSVTDHDLRMHWL